MVSEDGISGKPLFLSTDHFFQRVHDIASLSIKKTESPKNPFHHPYFYLFHQKIKIAKKSHPPSLSILSLDGWVERAGSRTCAPTFSGYLDVICSPCGSVTMHAHVEANFIIIRVGVRVAVRVTVRVGVSVGVGPRGGVISLDSGFVRSNHGRHIEVMAYVKEIVEGEVE